MEDEAYQSGRPSTRARTCSASARGREEREFAFNAAADSVSGKRDDEAGVRSNRNHSDAIGWQKDGKPESTEDTADNGI